ncbi:MAG: hypothetical protein ACRED0_11690 [Gammaproteobacteria bacterium]
MEREFRQVPGRGSGYRRKIESLESTDPRHQEKIEREKLKATADQGLIQIKALQRKAKTPYLNPRTMTPLSELG